MGIEDPALRVAAGLDPSVPKALTAGEQFVLPRFTAQFQCPFAPEYSGEVVIRFANVGDTLRIDRMVGKGTFFAEAVASLQVLIEKAPPAWWSKESNQDPELDIARIPDVEGVVDLYRSYSQWRATFRGGSLRG